MNKNEKKLLSLIKFSQIIVLVIIYIIMVIFLYLHSNNLFLEYLIELSIISIIVILLSLAISYSISKYIEKSILSYKNNLIEEMKNNEKKDAILFQQSKLATLGELLAYIAHQWKQPLSIITTAASGIKINKELGNTDIQFEINNLDGIINSVNYLSQTIDDFRNFHNPNTPKKNFSINDIINSSLRIIGSQLISEKIEIKKEIENFSIHGKQNELMQVLINIIANAIDQFEQINYKPKIIQLKTAKDLKYNYLYIWDNAGGIQDNTIDKIFEPYFTTKKSSKGTGIGLYMSQKILYNNFYGDLSVTNIKENYQNKEYKGAKFTIKLPILEKI